MHSSLAATQFKQEYSFDVRQLADCSPFSKAPVDTCPPDLEGGKSAVAMQLFGSCKSPKTNPSSA